MTGFSRRPLAAWLCCLFSTGALHAATDSGADAPSADMHRSALPWVNDAPRLRAERRFDLLGKQKAAQKATQPAPVRPGDAPQLLKPADDYPLFMLAERIEGQTDELTRAIGQVELRKAGQLLFADRVDYRPIDDEIDAQDNVRLFQNGAEIHTSHLRMRLTEQVGFAEETRYFIEREVDSEFYNGNTTVVTVASINGANSGAPMMLNVPSSYGLPTTLPPRRQTFATGDSSRVDFEGENQMTLSQATYSTCRPGDDDWHIKAERMHLDYDEGEGTARDASLWFQGVPLFYTPAAWFPISNERRSGLLMPAYKQTTNTGFDVTVPYYWNIAPNYDATFYPRYMSKRGVQLGVEARYLDERQLAESQVEYLPEDTNDNERRYAYSFRHVANLGRGFASNINWNGVSDDYYWEDMSSQLIKSSQTQLQRLAEFSYTPHPWLQSSMKFLRYQTLQPDPANPITEPYFIEPQINLMGFRADVMRTDLTLIGQYSRFTHNDPQTKDTGDRLVFYPQVAMPFVTPAFQITPKIGLHMTNYALDRSAQSVSQGVRDESISRVLPTFTLDSTMILEREDEMFGHAYIHTLEPRLYYVNIPYKNQDDIPLFDTGLSDFNFAQIFAENRYSGYDRINDAHQLTAAVTTRILDGTTGTEQFKAMLGQRYYFDEQRVTIPGETTRVDTFSNLIAGVAGLVAPKTYAEATWEYDYKEQTNERFSAGVRFQPDYGKVLSASYRYTRDPLNDQASLIDQIDVSGQWPIAPRWYGVARYNYSMRDDQLLEAIGGLEYNSGCWALRAVVQRLQATSTGEPNDSIFLQLELKDFSSIGSNPLGLLRRSIPGYGKTNELADSHRMNFTP